MDLLLRALTVAASQIGVTEEPLNSNSGPEVNEYLKSVGLGPGYSWCAAFVYWCFVQAAKEVGAVNPVVKTAGCMDHWAKAVKKGAKRFTAKQVSLDRKLIQPGQIFIMDFGKGQGHTGFVEKVEGDRIMTVEGNTNEAGARNGIGVFRRSRSIASINAGFIDYTGL